MEKRLPYYYIITLWITAIISVFLILVPLISTKNNTNTLLELSTVSLNSEIGTNNIDLSSQNISTDESGNLIFYNKTSFIRYFNNQFKEKDLSIVYENAIVNKASQKHMNSVRVVRKKQTALEKQNFSGSFDIKPVPEN